MGEIDEYLELVKEKIKAGGYIVQAVGGTESHPPIAYSVGLTEVNRPEIIIVGGFEPQIAHFCIESSVKSNRIYSDRDIAADILDNYPVAYREVTKERADRTALLARKLYPDFQLLQMFLPDVNGRFPWHPDCEKGFDAQAILDYISPPPED